MGKLWQVAHDGNPYTCTFRDPQASTLRCTARLIHVRMCFSHLAHVCKVVKICQTCNLFQSWLNSYRMHKSDAVTKKTVFKWFRRFREGNESLEDEERSGCLSISRNEENIIHVQTYQANQHYPFTKSVRSDCHLAQFRQSD
jgi:hypothetical protein